MFFDLPLLGLVVYPVGFAIPLALVALVLTVIVVRRDLKGAGVGAVAMIVALAVSGGLGWMVRLHGPAAWSGTFATALALAIVAINLLIYAWATRWSSEIHAGALVVWLALSIVTSFIAPGTSYLFTWPLLFTLIAARSGREIAWWIAAAVALLMLAGLAYTLAAIMLGVMGPGSAALAIVTALVVWLAAPLVMRAAGGRRRSWPLPAAFAGAAVVFAIIGATTSAPSANTPLPSALVFAQNADGGDALLGSIDGASAWAESAIGPPLATPPEWALSLRRGALFSAKPQARANLDPPTAKLLLDTLIDGARRVIVRINAPPGTTALSLRATGAPVVRTAIDARVVDTTRFRFHGRTWDWAFWNVPDSGVVFSIAVPPGAHFDLAMVARRPGLPASVVVPPRPSYVVPRQTGDVSAVYRTVRF